MVHFIQKSSENPNGFVVLPTILEVGSKMMLDYEARGIVHPDYINVH